jgi:hypothetical protein
MNEEVTAIWFSCRRVEILKQAIKSFIDSNTYPISEYIIVNDSGDLSIHDEIRRSFNNATFVFHPENVGLMRSIDLGYEHIRTNYFFHCEDDWSFIGKGGYIEKSLAIMRELPMIEEVWLRPDWNDHPSEPKVYHAGGVPYKFVGINHLKGQDGPYGWHGFTTAVALKRMEDYRKVAPYSKIPHEGTIWMHEQAIGEAYYKLGYRQVQLLENYIVNLCVGKKHSEYVTGFEK